MKNNNTKGLREGAMMVALTAVLILASRYVPFFSLIGAFICGVPLAALAARNGFKVTIPAVIAICGVTVLLAGDVFSAISVVLIWVLPGGVAGYMLGKNYPFFTALFATCITVCIGWLAEFLVMELFFEGIDQMITQALNGSRAMLDTMMNTIVQSGALPEGVSANEFEDMFIKEAEKLIRLYMPTLVVIISMVLGYITMRICGFVINRAKLAQVQVVPFSQIKAPNSMVTIALIGYLAVAFTGTNEALGGLLANLVSILYTIIAVCGFSVADFKLKEKMRSAWGRFCVYIAVFIIGGAFILFIVLGLIIVGILDSKRDFRKLGTAGE